MYPQATTNLMLLKCWIDGNVLHFFSKLCSRNTLFNFKPWELRQNCITISRLLYIFMLSYAVKQLQQSVVGGPLSLWALILQSSHTLRRKKKQHRASTVTYTKVMAVLFEINLFFSHSPAGKAAAARCQSWWWATRGICSGSASCLAEQCQSWWKRPGSAVMWSALPSLTGT